jgi:hypothetical protein
MDWEENISLRDLVVKLRNSAEDTGYFKKFISQVANDEKFASLLIFALSSELQDRQYRKEDGRDVGKKT